MTLRTPQEDRALCLHEAAHAVTAEVLRPGCVIGVEMDYTGGKPDVFGWNVYGDDVAALCTWQVWDYSDPDHQIAIAAGRAGELIDPAPDRFDRGDSAILRSAAAPAARVRARRRARALVKKHNLAIRRVAKALSEKRVMTGDEIRALIP